MKILIISQYFWPEDFRINDIAKGLKEKGHEVEVLTGVPNYPSGKKLEGFSLFKKSHSQYEGIKVYRTPMFVRGENGAIRLILNYLSFMTMGVIRIIPFLFKKYDRIFVFQISPITSCIPALFLGKLKKIKTYIYVQDLWPETFFSIINIKNQNIRKLLQKICSKIYKGFDCILIASKGYKELLLKQDIKEAKIKYFPQWAEDFYSQTSNEIREKDISNKNKKFTITFAGNIGKAQSVKTIIKAAEYILKKDDDINIIWKIIGDGSEFENIKKFANDFELGKCVEFLGRKPSSEMPKYFEESDALIATLSCEEILKVTLPAKVQSYMAAKKPILVAISGEGNKIIAEANCGLACEAEDYISLAQNAIKLAKMSDEKRNVFANNGKKYFEENFTREKLLNELDCFLRV